jgi:hypothetical protein
VDEYVVETQQLEPLVPWIISTPLRDLGGAVVWFLVAGVAGNASEVEQSLCENRLSWELWIGWHRGMNREERMRLSKAVKLCVL